MDLIKKGKFIVFEGLDGSGKSSLISAFELELKKSVISYVRTREPGGSLIGDELREIILRKKTNAVPCAQTELLLYEAARAQHVHELIIPSLQKGSWVLCDRFAASSVAFQSGGRVLPKSQVEWLNQFATMGLYPDLYVLLDLDVNQARARQNHRQGQTGVDQDRMESEQDSFHERVRNSFLEQAKEKPQSWLVLNAQLSTEQMLDSLMHEIQQRGWG